MTCDNSENTNLNLQTKPTNPPLVATSPSALKNADKSR